MSPKHETVSQAAPVIPRKDLHEWWRSAVIYQIYPRSFNDGNGDGVGDLPGVIERLDYLKRLGIDAIWFSPFFKSPQVDAGYDVSDYFDIDPLFGTLDDFKKLLAGIHSRGMKCIIDMVPNHCSDQHPSFQEALAAGPKSPERERFIFRYNPDGVPNNWRSEFGGSAWEPVQPHSGLPEDAGWWYLHLFAPEQPDWNWENPEVDKLFLDYLRFWSDLGVDGFRVDVAHGLVKAAGFPDDPVDEEVWEKRLSNGQETPVSGPMWDQDGVHEIYRRWRHFLDEHYGRDRMMVAESWVPTLHRQARYVREDEMSQAFNFEYLLSHWGSPRQRHIIEESLAENSAVGAPTTWVLSNHDQMRHASKYGYDAPLPNLSMGIGSNDPQPDVALGRKRARAASLFMLGLPGSAYLYQGEELGLGDHTTLDDDLRQDPTWKRSGHQVRGRDGCRVPLPWNSTATSLGFSTSPRTWLPFPPEYRELAVDLQESDADSTLNLYREALVARRERALGTAECIEWIDTDPGVLAFRSGNTVVAVNTSHAGHPLPVAGKIVVASNPQVGRSGSEWSQDKWLPADGAVWLEVH